MRISHKHRIHVVLLFAVLQPCIAVSQDTVQLKEVQVVSDKALLSQGGKKSIKLDSTLRSFFLFANAAEALAVSTPVFIKSYGPGALATSAMRGGSAAHTAVLWNGINIQNNMLGQTNLAQLPVYLFDDLTVEMGGSSALWGSGAVAGSVMMNNRTPFDKGSSFLTSIGAGSFGTINALVGFAESKSKLVSSTKILYQRSTNNFAYRDIENVEHTRTHATFLSGSLLQELRWKASVRDELSLNAWMNAGVYQLPQLNRAEQGMGQVDRSVRAVADWAHRSSGWVSATKAALLVDRINYNDTSANIKTDNRVYTFVAENENSLQLNASNTVQFGMNYTTSKARSDNYRGVKDLSKFALLFSDRIYLLDKAILLQGTVRQEFFSAGNLPVTGNITAELKKYKWRISANAARVYRQPTLNELFWLPGGNPQLKPEEGFTFEGNAEYKFTAKRFSLLISGSAYSRKISNWVLWVPGSNGNPGPVNIMKVWSRGTETSWKLNYGSSAQGLSFAMNTAYVLSTIDESEMSNLAGKQLVYTPRYQGNASMNIYFAAFSILFQQQYTGYRFSTSDHSEWLPPYSISSLRVTQIISFADIRCVFYAGMYNILDAHYFIIAGQPLPGRNFELGVRFQTIKKQKPNT
jgi:vitamin B12 transporter